jgi:hypothetical protein
MGYTHYCRRVKELPSDKFNQFSNDCKAIAAYAKKVHGIDISGWDGNGDPVFDAGEVCFNGSFADGDDYETFRIERVYEPNQFEDVDESGMYFTFCKTARRPYDIVVLGCLLFAKFRFGNLVKITSDGGSDALNEAYSVFSEIMPTGVDI